MVGQRHAPARTIQPQDMAHARVGAKVARAALSLRLFTGVDQPCQRGAHLAQRGLRVAPVERDLQRVEQHIQRGLAVEREHHVVLRGRDGVQWPHGLAALRDTRHQRHARAKRHA